MDGILYWTYGMIEIDLGKLSGITGLWEAQKS